jgi:hypothetical protein
MDAVGKTQWEAGVFFLIFWKAVKSAEFKQTSNYY